MHWSIKHKLSTVGFALKNQRFFCTTCHHREDSFIETSYVILPHWPAAHILPSVSHSPGLHRAPYRSCWQQSLPERGGQILPMTLSSQCHVRIRLTDRYMYEWATPLKTQTGLNTSPARLRQKHGKSRRHRSWSLSRLAWGCWWYLGHWGSNSQGVRSKQKTHDTPHFHVTVPSASSILGMSRCFSAMSKARFKFPRGSS